MSALASATAFLRSPSLRSVERSGRPPSFGRDCPRRSTTPLALALASSEVTPPRPSCRILRCRMAFSNWLSSAASAAGGAGTTGGTGSAAETCSPSSSSCGMNGRAVRRGPPCRMRVVFSGVGRRAGSAGESVPSRGGSAGLLAPPPLLPCLIGTPAGRRPGRAGLLALRGGSAGLFAPPPLLPRLIGTPVGCRAGCAGLSPPRGRSVLGPLLPRPIGTPIGSRTGTCSGSGSGSGSGSIRPGERRPRAPPLRRLGTGAEESPGARGPGGGTG